MEPHDQLIGLPALAGFGEALVAAVREDDARGRRHIRRGRLPARTLVLAALLLLLVAAVAAAATVAILRASVIQAPGPRDLPLSQTPVAGTSWIPAARAADPAGGPPWAMRVSHSRTGLACTTMGQVSHGVFGIVGLDGVFRRIPESITDGCTSIASISGGRVVVGRRPQDAITVSGGVMDPKSLPVSVSTACPYGCLPITVDGRTTNLRLDRTHAFVVAARGYPEDHSFQQLRLGDGYVPDPLSAPEWVVAPEPLTLPQLRCARVFFARAPLDAPVETPPLCVRRHGPGRPWAVHAARYGPGMSGGDWRWGAHAARTVVWGIARDPKAVYAVVLHGAGGPRDVPVSWQGAFAVVLPPSVDPRRLRVSVETRARAWQTVGATSSPRVPHLVGP